MRPFLNTLAVGLGLLVLGAAWTGVGCSSEEPNDAPRTGGGGERGGLSVVVSIPPLKGIVEPLLPAGSRIEVLIPPGVNEHGYEIPPSRLMALTRADLVVYVGLGLEPQVEKVLAEHPRADGGQVVVEFAQVVGEQDDAAHHDHDHDHGHDHHHHHGVDPHLWLDPVFVGRLAESVAERVADIAEARGSEPREALTARRDAHLKRIGAVDSAYAEFVRGFGPDKAIVVTHNAYGRLAERYGLKIVPLAGLTGGEPSPAAIQAAIAAVRTQQGGGDGGGAVFVEPQMPSGAMRRVAEATGARVLVLDPLGDGDWFKLMETNLESLKAGLSTQAD